MEKIVRQKSHAVTWHIAIVLLQLAVLVSVLLFWKPWDPALGANTRKITITGSASVQAEPDQFVFTPSYTRDKTSDVAKLNDSVIAGLKKLGVTDAQIENNASRYGSPDIYYVAPDAKEGEEQTSLSLTVTVTDKELAQKVQNYLLTTEPSGTITPYPSFSTAKQKELTEKVRAEALADARKKADTTANELSVKVGKVIEISEGSSGGGCSGLYDCPVRDVASPSSGAEDGKTISVQPGTDEFTYSVTVVYELN